MNTRSLFVRLFGGIALAALLLAVLVMVTNAVFGRPRLSANDLFLCWIIDGKDYFVRLPRPGGNDLIATHEDLRRLDNGVMTFTEKKSPGTFRIFCVGGSTTRGWPFHPVLSYPRLLDLSLKDVAGNRRVEVINAGFMALDSFSDVQLVREICRYEPDLLLIHEGRNDVITAPFHLSSRTGLLKAHVWLLRHVYLYGALRNHLSGDQFDHAAKVRRLMERSVPAGKGNILREAFERNLDAMAASAREARCTMMILTQVLRSSERDAGSGVHQVNEWLRAYGRKNDIPVIDMDETFRTSGIPEDRLVIPVSVHPDFPGYVLMAQTVIGEIERSGIVAPAREWDRRKRRSDAHYLAAMRFTPGFASSVYRVVVAPLCDAAGANDEARRYRERADYYLSKKRFRQEDIFPVSR